LIAADDVHKGEHRAEIAWAFVIKRPSQEIDEVRALVLGAFGGVAAASFAHVTGGRSWYVGPLLAASWAFAVEYREHLSIAAAITATVSALIASVLVATATIFVLWTFLGT
jgi:hypothetical protein